MGRRNRPWFGRDIGGRGKMMQGNPRVPLSGSSVADHRKEVPTTREHELDTLKTEATAITHELDVVKARIAGIEQTKGSIRLRALVDAHICIGCGVCQQVCPTAAISVDTVARVDLLKCTGCGLCTTECPRAAITLQKV